MDSRLHDVLSKLVGTWRSEGRVVDGSEQDGDTWAGHDIYEWFPGEQHLVHRVDVEIFGGRNEGIEIFSAGEGPPDSFDETSFNADGSVERGAGSIDAEGRYHNDLENERATVTFEGEGRMSAHWEKRRADGSWTDWMEVTFTRIAGPHVEIRSKDDHRI